MTIKLQNKLASSVINLFLVKICLIRNYYWKEMEWPVSTTPYQSINVDFPHSNFKLSHIWLRTVLVFNVAVDTSTHTNNAIPCLCVMQTYQGGCRAWLWVIGCLTVWLTNGTNILYYGSVSHWKCVYYSLCIIIWNTIEERMTSGKNVAFADEWRGIHAIHTWSPISSGSFDRIAAGEWREYRWAFRIREKHERMIELMSE